MNLFEMLTVVYKYKKLYEKRCCEIMKEYDLRVVDLDILFYVAHSGHRNLAKDIVDMGMSKANVSKSVEHLRQKGLVILSEDREDRRCVHIVITPCAEPVVEKIAQVRREMCSSLMEGITESDKNTLLRVMHQIEENMNTEWMDML